MEFRDWGVGLRDWCLPPSRDTPRLAPRGPDTTGVGFGVWGLECGVQDSGFMISGFGFRVSDFGFRVLCLGIEAFELTFRRGLPGPA